ncbi:uncharacterized protein A1O9_01162 [Exophiala aquamarina CBS 119918]|uniref:Uncharacterized protein n=1 Tax=Exophiala aquamarina CBS 119918 TaxID=1182545 RepID=A0A072Q5H9_9EURO|nr:uncharacterized protein A1O9_01162 [Exophiala aquamarina CBS 119918]KEF63185.1 hypothetical protein A1O9_01162 [Exophiala aquamarina CBS 119918]
MTSQPSFLDTSDWPLPKSPIRTPSLDCTTLSPGSETGSIHFSHYPLPPTPVSSRPTSEKGKASVGTDLIVRVPLQRPVHMYVDSYLSEHVARFFSCCLIYLVVATSAFSKGNSLFRLKYSSIDIRKDVAGNIKRIELIPGTKAPIPHLEQPITSSKPQISRISFLEEQTVQSATTIFQAQPQYTFETFQDCIAFQENLLAQEVVFTAGVAEAKSKGRGEEAISQNLRILRARNGRQIIVMFCNSQRSERKRYISIPHRTVDCIDHIEHSKRKFNVTLTLRPNFDLLAQLKSISIVFLDDHGTHAL